MDYAVSAPITPLIPPRGSLCNNAIDNATIYDDILPDDDDVLRAMAEQPIMIERPILVCGDRAVVGRPDPASILSLLDDEDS
jgi:hypothetical protein